MPEEGGGLSKSARKRANQAANKAAAAAEAAAAEAAAAAPPAPEPKSKAKPKAKAEPKAEPKIEPKAKAKGKAKAEPKAEPKAAAKGQAKAEPKGKAKAESKAKAEPEPKPEPPAPPAPKAKGKASAKKAAAKKAKAAKEEEEPVAKKKSDEGLVNYTMDDGTGGDWEEASGMSKKMQKRKEKRDEEKAFIAQIQAQAGGQLPKNTVPGMADPRALAAAAKIGSSQSVSADVARILGLKAAGGAAPVEEAKPVQNLSTASVTVPDNKIGVVIGPKGATIKLIQEKTKVERIDTTGGIFTITGEAKGVADAETAIQELIEKSYCSLLYDDFSENFVNVHPNYFPDIIGSKGCIIQAIKKALKVEVNIPVVPPNSHAAKKFKVSLAGSQSNVEQAKEVINSIVTHGHHEVTHPGQIHEELEIDKWSLKYVIGTRGSEMRHIQNNYSVKMCIPREYSVNTKVVIVGEPDNVERAKAYVEKVVWNAEHQAKKGRDAVDDGDTWGEEEGEEPWMKEYMYKRR